MSIPGEKWLALASTFKFKSTGETYSVGDLEVMSGVVLGEICLNIRDSVMMVLADVYVGLPVYYVSLSVRLRLIVMCLLKFLEDSALELIKDLTIFCLLLAEL